MLKEKADNWNFYRRVLRSYDGVIGRKQMASTFNLRFSVSVEAFKSYVNLNQRITLNNFQIVLFRMVDLTITKANETPQYVEQ